MKKTKITLHLLWFLKFFALFRQTILCLPAADFSNDSAPQLLCLVQHCSSTLEQHRQITWNNKILRLRKLRELVNFPKQVVLSGEWALARITKEQWPRSAVDKYRREWRIWMESITYGSAYGCTHTRRGALSNQYWPKQRQHAARTVWTTRPPAGLTLPTIIALHTP